MSEATAYPKDHNRPPVVLPKDEEMLEDLRRKYPEVEKEIPEFEKAFSTYPTELTLKDADVAKGLSDLIDQTKKARKAWKAFGASEKSPLNKLVKIVGNFFTSADEKIEALLGKYEPVLEAYIQQVNDQKERERQAEIARQEKIAEEKRAAADEETRRAAAAAAEAEKQRQAEADARAAAAKAKAEAEAREAAAAAAKQEEKRLADARRERERLEKDKNATSIREIKTNMKTAERLNDLAEAEESTDAEGQNLDALVRAGGIVGNLAAEIFHSELLDDEQKTYLTETRARLGLLRTAFNSRYNKREQAKREKAQREADARDAAAAEDRRKKRAAEEAEYAAAKKKREDEDAAATAASEAKRRADADAREAREAARGHERDAKDAGKGAAKAADEADRADNRADRLESRGEAKTSVRGDLGANAHLAENWKHFVDDEAAVRKTLGPLGPHIALDAIKAAAFFYMRAHQAGFEGERVLPAELPGVRFALQEDLRV